MATNGGPTAGVWWNPPPQAGAGPRWRCEPSCRGGDGVDGGGRGGGGGVCDRNWGAASANTSGAGGWDSAARQHGAAIVGGAGWGNSSPRDVTDVGGSLAVGVPKGALPSSGASGTSGGAGGGGLTHGGASKRGLVRRSSTRIPQASVFIARSSTVVAVHEGETGEAVPWQQCPPGQRLAAVSSRVVMADGSAEEDETDSDPAVADSDADGSDGADAVAPVAEAVAAHRRHRSVDVGNVARCGDGGACPSGDRRKSAGVVAAMADLFGGADAAVAAAAAARVAAAEREAGAGGPPSTSTFPTSSVDSYFFSALSADGDGAPAAGAKPPSRGRGRRRRQRQAVAKAAACASATGAALPPVGPSAVSAASPAAAASAAAVAGGEGSARRRVAAPTPPTTASSASASSTSTSSSSSPGLDGGGGGPTGTRLTSSFLSALTTDTGLTDVAAADHRGEPAADGGRGGAVDLPPSMADLDSWVPSVAAVVPTDSLSDRILWLDNADSGLHADGPPADPPLMSDNVVVPADTCGPLPAVAVTPLPAPRHAVRPKVGGGAAHTPGAAGAEEDDGFSLPPVTVAPFPNAPPRAYVNPARDVEVDTPVLVGRGRRPLAARRFASTPPRAPAGTAADPTDPADVAAAAVAAAAAAGAAAVRGWAGLGDGEGGSGRGGGSGSGRAVGVGGGGAGAGAGAGVGAPPGLPRWASACSAAAVPADVPAPNDAPWPAAAAAASTALAPVPPMPPLALPGAAVIAVQTAPRSRGNGLSRAFKGMRSRFRRRPSSSSRASSTAGSPSPSTSTGRGGSAAASADALSSAPWAGGTSGAASPAAPPPSASSLPPYTSAPPRPPGAAAASSVRPPPPAKLHPTAGAYRDSVDAPSAAALRLSLAMDEFIDFATRPPAAVRGRRRRGSGGGWMKRLRGALVGGGGGGLVEDGR